MVEIRQYDRLVRKKPLHSGLFCKICAPTLRRALPAGTGNFYNTVFPAKIRFFTLVITIFGDQRLAGLMQAWLLTECVFTFVIASACEFASAQFFGVPGYHVPGLDCCCVNIFTN